MHMEWPKKKPPGQRAPSDAPSGGFTLIELLVVVTILAALVSLILGVGKYVYDEARKQQTVGTMAILLSAVQAFEDVKGYYPSDGAVVGHDENAAKDRIMYMWFQLTDPADTDSMEKPRNLLSKIPTDFTVRPQATTNNCYVLDSYDRCIDYRANGALGGGPVFISAGPSGFFDDDDARPAKYKTKMDDMRSDSK